MRHNLLHKDLINEMIHTAVKLVIQHGLLTRNTDLLNHAARSGLPGIKGDHIYPSEDAIESCLISLRKNKVPESDKHPNHHGWQDMIVNHSAKDSLNVRISDLPFEYCDYRKKEIIPLTRQQVIEGTKLI